MGYYAIEPSITKEFLLSKNNEETYMSYYLGLPVKKGLFKSPLRNDRHVTCSFFRGKKGTLYFKDFADGSCLSFIGVVMAKYKVKYNEALQIIAADFGFIRNAPHKQSVVKVQPKFNDVSQTFIQIEMKDFSPKELNWWASYGINIKILSKYRVFSCKNVFLNGKLFAHSDTRNPIFGYYFGKKDNAEQWRIYMPERKEFRFIGNVPTKTVQGYKQLAKTGNLLVITKSLKDVMCLNSLGVKAIAPNSETQFVSDKMLEELKQRFKYIVLLYDNDLTGVRFTNKIRKAHPELYATIIPRKWGAKDISDFYRKYGREKTMDFVVNSILKLKQLCANR